MCLPSSQFLIAVALVTIAAFSPDPASAQPPTRFEIVARLTMPQDGFLATKYQAFRSVALRLPYAYVLDRKGHLFVFKFSLEDTDQTLRAVRVIEDTGDGDDLILLDDVLIFSRRGSVGVYSLADPAAPNYVGTFGPSRQRHNSQSIVHDGELLFLIGKRAISSYNVSVPRKPRFLATMDNNRHGWSGCIIGKFLYVSDVGLRGADQEGIAVYDISDPQRIKEIGFVRTDEAPYDLFHLKPNRLLASFADKSLIEFGDRVYGRSAIFGLSQPEKPRLLKEFFAVGGRSTTLLSVKDDQYIVCNGGVFAIDDDRMSQSYKFDQGGSTLDGLPYHGDSSDMYAALALDQIAVVLRPIERLTVRQRVEALVNDVEQLLVAFFAIVREYLSIGFSK